MSVTFGAHGYATRYSMLTGSWHVSTCKLCLRLFPSSGLVPHAHTWQQLMLLVKLRLSSLH
jgi:hypothetical protein